MVWPSYNCLLFRDTKFVSAECLEEMHLPNGLTDLLTDRVTS